jgi:hypothetical protein
MEAQRGAGKELAQPGGTGPAGGGRKARPGRGAKWPSRGFGLGKSSGHGGGVPAQVHAGGGASWPSQLERHRPSRVTPWQPSRGKEGRRPARGEAAQPEKENDPAQPGYCSATPAQVAICRPGSLTPAREEFNPAWTSLLRPSSYIPARWSYNPAYAAVCWPGKIYSGLTLLLNCFLISCTCRSLV